MPQKTEPLPYARRRTFQQGSHNLVAAEGCAKFLHPIVLAGYCRLVLCVYSVSSKLDVAGSARIQAGVPNAKFYANSATTNFGDANKLETAKFILPTTRSSCLFPLTSECRDKCEGRYGLKHAEYHTTPFP